MEVFYDKEADILKVSFNGRDNHIMESFDGSPNRGNHRYENIEWYVDVESDTQILLVRKFSGFGSKDTFPSLSDIIATIEEDGFILSDSLVNIINMMGNVVEIQACVNCKEDKNELLC